MTADEAYEEWKLEQFGPDEDNPNWHDLDWDDAFHAGWDACMRAITLATYRSTRPVDD